MTPRNPIRPNCAGTARALHELRQFRITAEEYGDETALCLTAKAIRRRFPDITVTDVRGAVRVIHALESGVVSIGEERHMAEEQAMVAADELLGVLSRPGVLTAG